MARADNAMMMRRATYASVTTAGILIAAKLGAFLYTDSVALLSSLIDSVVDAMASGVSLLAVRHATTPADREHRFGHGKAEPLAALAQAMFVTGSALFLIFEAIRRLADPPELRHSEVGIAVMLLAIVLTFALTRYQAYVVRKTGSLAVKADALHYIGDLLINGSVIVAILLVSEFGWRLADPLFGIGIAGVLLVSAVRIGRQSLDMLMDRELPEEERQRILAIAKEHPEVMALHDLRTRASGPDLFIQLHLELDGSLPLLRSHEIADDVEAKICAAFPDAEVIIHQDPHGLEEPPKVVGER